jgi:hypothetical protein
MLFHVPYHCLASYDLIFNESVHFHIINRLIVSAPPCTSNLLIYTVIPHSYVIVCPEMATLDKTI